jgi:CRISPR-associated protein Cmr6
MPYPCSRLLKTVLEGRGSRPIGHPGLLMDRYAAYPSDHFDKYEQTDSRPHIDAVCSASANAQPPPNGLWQSLATALSADVWTQTTIWRLAAHLSRATSIENGSICLHPIYGFPYLPGTGLKGLAHAWAVLCDPQLKDERQRIFGCGPGGLADTLALSRAASGVTGHDNCGSVIFLEAWPTGRVTLEVDIVNNHHKEYYGSSGQTPPGDWESPNPVYFLTVPANTMFQFGVAARSAGPHAANDLAQAKEWLAKGLRELGAGAKTAAGYGYFR